MIQKYYNPLNEEKIKQGYERPNEMTNTKNTETIIKKKQKSIIKDIGT